MNGTNYISLKSILHSISGPLLLFYIRCGPQKKSVKCCHQKRHFVEKLRYGEFHSYEVLKHVQTDVGFLSRQIPLTFAVLRPGRPFIRNSEIFSYFLSFQNHDSNMSFKTFNSVMDRYKLYTLI